MIQFQTLAVTTVALLACTTASAQQPAKFHWQPGQVLTYRVAQQTTETEEVGDSKAESGLKLNHVKRWQVLAVDAAGTATLQQSLTALRIERRSPSGATIVFDSTKPDQSDPDMVKQLSKYVGAPLATLRIDAFGKVVEVKESQHVPASRYENELPFTIMFPAEGVKTGQVWQRAYTMTLDAPLGTGEKYAAGQKYMCKEMAGANATILFKTALTTVPQDKGDHAKLVQFLPEGQATFNLEQGRMEKVQWSIDQEVKGHQGEGSSYKIQSTYLEEFVGN